MFVPPAISDPRLRIGSVIAGKYRVLEVLGRGGMGIVYEAVHTGIGKHVALKFLEGPAPDQTRARARFLREAKTAGLVESPHVVQVFDSGISDDETPFLVLELLRGQDLRELLKTEGRLSVAQALSIAEQVLRAMDQTHAAGIVHRDLKPENIFLCRIAGADPLVKVLDFGISKVAATDASGDTITREGAVLGTAHYMSPEQACGEPDIDRRTDLYALGSILYEMLTGRAPHAGKTGHAILVDICTTDAPDVRLLAPEVPAELALIIARALSRQREQRYSSATEFLEALLRIHRRDRSSDPAQARSETTRMSEPSAERAATTSKMPPDQRPLPGRWIVAALLLALVLSGFGIALLNRQLKLRRQQEQAALWASAAPSAKQRIAASPGAPPEPALQHSATKGVDPVATASAGTTPNPALSSRAGRASNPVPRVAPGHLQLKTEMP